MDSHIALRLLAALLSAAPIGCRGRPASLAVTPERAVIFSRAEAVQLRAAVFSGNGKELRGRNVSWESLNQSVATVDQFGRAVPVSSGDAEVRARCERAEGKAMVKVRIVSAIRIEPEAIELEGKGGTVSLKALMSDEKGGAIADLSPEWSCLSQAVCSVDAEGNLTATGTGTTDVVAGAGDVQARARVTVSPPEIASLTVSPLSAEMKPGDKLQLEAAASDAAGDRIEGVRFVWSSSYERGVRVSADGLVTALRPGKAAVSATASGKKAEATIIVR